MTEENKPNPEGEQETPEQKWDKERQKLNEEAMSRRREAKEAKTKLAATEAKVTKLYEALGVTDESDLDTRLDEVRAAAEKGGKVGNDLVQVQARASQLEKENKTLKSTLENLSKERDTFAGSLRDTLIGHELQKGFAHFEVRDDQRDILETALKSKGLLKVNDKQKAVWIVRDEDGDEIGELPVKDGLAQFFEKNPSFLPAKTPQGSGQGPSTKVKPGRTDTSIAGLFGNSGAGVLQVDSYMEKRGALGLEKKKKA